jgi:inorganic pyrophosphatase
MRSAQDFPFDYGFVPKTMWHDGDALDVMILATYPLQSGTLVRVRPVGIMEVIDTGESDNKILAVPIDDVRWDKVQDLADVNPHTIKEIEHFYSTYKKLQNDEVEVKGFKGKNEAKNAFKEGLKLYTQKYQTNQG